MRKAIPHIAVLAGVLVALPAFAGWDEGVAAFKSKNFQQAAAEFKELVDQNPEGYRGHYMLGLTLEQLKRKEEALSHLRKAYDLNPNDLSIKMALGRTYFNLRRYGDANKLLSTVDASALPANQRVAFYQIRGQSRFKSGNESGAVGDFAQLAKLNPQDAQMQYMYGTTALSAGQLDAAIGALGKAVQLAPSDNDKKRAYIQALVKKARTTRDKASKKSSYAKAAGVAKQLTASAPTYDNYVLQISAELGAGSFTDAIKTGNAGLSKKSDDWLMHYYLGQAYSSAGQYTQAEQPLLAARERASGNDTKLVWRQLGFIYEKQKEYSKSIEAYRTAGDNAAVARVQENQNTAEFNKNVEEENRLIKEMEAEAKRLEKELEELEGGGR